MDFKLEVCCADLPSLRAAVAGGAHRVELCQALDMDGLTPSAGMIEIAVNSGIAVHVLIRPRGGNFVYSEDEVDCMIYDIQIARKLGAQGVVIGALTPEGDVDIQACHRMVEGQCNARCPLTCLVLIHGHRIDKFLQSILSSVGHGKTGAYIRGTIGIAVIRWTGLGDTGITRQCRRHIGHESKVV